MAGPKRPRNNLFIIKKSQNKEIQINFRMSYPSSLYRQLKKCVGETIVCHLEDKCNLLRLYLITTSFPKNSQSPVPYKRSLPVLNRHPLPVLYNAPL